MTLLDMARELTIHPRSEPDDPVFGDVLYTISERIQEDFGPDDGTAITDAIAEAARIIERIVKDDDTVTGSDLEEACRDVFNDIVSDTGNKDLLAWVSLDHEDWVDQYLAAHGWDGEDFYALLGNAQTLWQTEIANRLLDYLLEEA